MPKYVGERDVPGEGNLTHDELRMCRRPVGRFLITALCSFLLFHAAAVSGFSLNPQLLQLVPPGSQIVAGMSGPSISGQLRGFLLITLANELDHKDFFALTGGDPSRGIQEFVFVAIAGADGVPREHSLLVSGHFDRDAIFRMASDGSATRRSYHNIAVLAVQPFTREAGSFKELRWLAIPDDRIAIWGSVLSVQRELDRWIANSPADPELLERLSGLDRRDETWCLLPAPKPGDGVASILGKLDPRLEALADEGRSIQYGIHIGRSVEITASSIPVTQPGRNTPGEPPGAEPIALSYLLSGSGEAGASATVRVKIPHQAYEKWLADFSAGGTLAIADSGSKQR